MASLNLDPDFFDHPKSRRLAATCGHGSEICILRLWCYAGKYHYTDGVLKGYSLAEIEGIANWKGEHGALLQALLHVGFLEKREDGFAIHDWEEYQGHIFAFKVKASAMAKSRWDAVRNATSNAGSIPVSNASTRAGARASIAKQVQKDPEGGPGGNHDPHIPTLTEVASYGEALNIIPEVCKGFFDHHQGNRLWLNRNGELIDWKHKLGVWNANERTGKFGNRNGGKNETPDWRKIQILEEAICKHVANSASTFYSPKATDLERADFRTKREKVKQLKAKELSNV